MTSVVLREDFDAASVRRLARNAEDADQARRLLAIAAVYDGMSRGDAARIGGMDRQTLRDWAHRFNTDGAVGLINRTAPGNPRRLTPEQEAELERLVEAGPAAAGLGHLARWRCADLNRRSRSATISVLPTGRPGLSVTSMWRARLCQPKVSRPVIINP